MIGVVLSATNFLEGAGKGWPHWRGPDRTGVSSETGLLQSWPKEGPKRLWLYRDAGIGYSSFSVVGDRLYTLGARGDKEYIIAVDVTKGKDVWVKEIGAILTNGWGDGPRGTPTVDGSRVYAMGGVGNLVCVNAADGEVIWNKTMGDLGGSAPGWGFTESVLVDGNLVVCTPGGPQGAIAALNKKTGEVVWQSKEFTSGAQYPSIIPADNHGVHQYIQLTMESLVGIGAADGKLLWKVDFAGSTAVIPTPIFRDGAAYATSGYGAGCKLIQLDAEQKPTEIYVNKKMKNHHGGVVLLGDHLYGYSDGVGWACQDFKSGELLWNDKTQLSKGSLTCADGRLYCLEEKSGIVGLLEASPKGYKEHGRFTLDPLTTLRKPSWGIWAHPVVADGKLYLRDQELLFCYDVKAK
jgi:outer membrane protein assembly factor BamB